jgi:hypothetical protein
MAPWQIVSTESKFEAGVLVRYTQMKHNFLVADSCVCGKARRKEVTLCKPGSCQDIMMGSPLENFSVSKYCHAVNQRRSMSSSNYT